MRDGILRSGILGSDHDNYNNIYCLSAFWGLDQVFRRDFWGRKSLLSDLRGLERIKTGTESGSSGWVPDACEVRNRGLSNRPHSVRDFFSFQSGAITDLFGNPLRELLTAHCITLGPKRFTYQLSLPNRIPAGTPGNPG